MNSNKINDIKQNTPNNNIDPYCAIVSTDLLHRRIDPIYTLLKILKKYAGIDSFFSSPFKHHKVLCKELIKQLETIDEKAPMASNLSNTLKKLNEQKDLQIEATGDFAAALGTFLSIYPEYKKEVKSEIIDKLPVIDIFKEYFYTDLQQRLSNYQNFEFNDRRSVMLSTPRRHTIDEKSYEARTILTERSIISFMEDKEIREKVYQIINDMFGDNPHAKFSDNNKYMCNLYRLLYELNNYANEKERQERIIPLFIQAVENNVSLNLPDDNNLGVFDTLFNLLNNDQKNKIFRNFHKILNKRSDIIYRECSLEFSLVNQIVSYDIPAEYKSNIIQKLITELSQSSLLAEERVQLATAIKKMATSLTEEQKIVLYDKTKNPYNIHPFSPSALKIIYSSVTDNTPANVDEKFFYEYAKNDLLRNRPDRASVYNDNYTLMPALIYTDEKQFHNIFSLLTYEEREKVLDIGLSSLASNGMALSFQKLISPLDEKTITSRVDKIKKSIDVSSEIVTDEKSKESTTSIPDALILALFIITASPNQLAIENKHKLTQLLIGNFNKTNGEGYIEGLFLLVEHKMLTDEEQQTLLNNVLRKFKEKSLKLNSYLLPALLSSLSSLAKSSDNMQKEILDLFCYMAQYRLTNPIVHPWNDWYRPLPMNNEKTFPSVSLGLHELTMIPWLTTKQINETLFSLPPIIKERLQMIHIGKSILHTDVSNAFLNLSRKIEDSEIQTQLMRNMIMFFEDNLDVSVLSEIYENAKRHEYNRQLATELNAFFVPQSVPPDVTNVMASYGKKFK